MPAAAKSVDLRAALDRFLATARQPVLIEPGHDPIALSPDHYALSGSATRPTIECWNEATTLCRRIAGIHTERRGKLELLSEHFGGRTGRVLLIDLANPAHATATRRSDRLKFREQFRAALMRHYPAWRVAELSTDPDLEHTLSPAYPRAFLRQGTTGLAAIAAPEDATDPDGALTFGLIWLDYLRRRQPRLSVSGLIVFLPIGSELNTCHRVRHLDAARAQVAVFVHGPGVEEAVDPEDYTNFTTHVEPIREPTPWPGLVAFPSIDGVQVIVLPNGSTSLQLRGIEFARTSHTELLYGIDHKHAGPIEHAVTLAHELARMRRHDAEDRRNPLYLRQPEAWLESQLRAQIQALDGTLQRAPIYGQVPHFAAADRAVIDLLTVDFEGRLVVIEVKAVEDPHLPLQALDYWMRVKWHQERGDFERAAYFPNIRLRPDPPRLILAAPALEFHPSNESILRLFASDVNVERLGLGVEWRRELKVVLRQICR